MRKKPNYSQEFHTMARYKHFVITRFTYHSFGAGKTYNTYKGHSYTYEKEFSANTLDGLKKKIDRFIAKRKGK